MIIDRHRADLRGLRLSFAGLPPRPYNSQLRPFPFINTVKPSKFEAIVINPNMSTINLAF